MVSNDFAAGDWKAHRYDNEKQPGWHKLYLAVYAGHSKIIVIVATLARMVNIASFQPGLILCSVKMIPVSIDGTYD